jgi:hypothetical protein
VQFLHGFLMDLSVRAPPYEEEKKRTAYSACYECRLPCDIAEEAKNREEEQRSAVLPPAAALLESGTRCHLVLGQSHHVLDCVLVAASIWIDLTKHKIRYRESSVHASQDTLTNADTGSVNV